MRSPCRSRSSSLLCPWPAERFCCISVMFSLLCVYFPVRGPSVEYSPQAGIGSRSRFSPFDPTRILQLCQIDTLREACACSQRSNSKSLRQGLSEIRVGWSHTQVHARSNWLAVDE